VVVRNAVPGLRCPRRAIARLVHTLDASGRVPLPPGEISIALLGSPAMARLHARFMDDPSPTDVLTFPGDATAGIAGDICVCAPVARDYADAHHRPFAEEISLYIVHGCLHLAGFDDHAAPQRRAMRHAERDALALLRAAGAVPAFSWGSPRPGSPKPSRRPR
jgi:probable rRNA maturation factor